MTKGCVAASAKISGDQTQERGLDQVWLGRPLDPRFRVRIGFKLTEISVRQLLLTHANTKNLANKTRREKDKRK